jgi:hypothetical protein
LLAKPTIFENQLKQLTKNGRESFFEQIEAVASAVLELERRHGFAGQDPAETTASFQSEIDQLRAEIAHWPQTLVPGRIARVFKISIDPDDDLLRLLERLLNLISAEHIVVVVFRPLSCYLKATHATETIGLFNIMALSSLWPNDPSKLATINCRDAYRFLPQS